VTADPTGPGRPVEGFLNPRRISAMAASGDGPSRYKLSAKLIKISLRLELSGRFTLPCRHYGERRRSGSGS